MDSTSNQSIAETLREIGEYLEMQNVPFKPRALEKAAEVIRDLAEEVEETYRKGGIKALQDIPGVGVSISQKIEEFIKTGKVKELEALRKKMPVNLAELHGIEGLGPKTIKKLYQELHVTDRASLEKVIKTGKIAKLSGFGKKSEERIERSLGFRQANQRSIISDIMPQVRRLAAFLESVPGAEKVTVAGSVRRRKETIGDVDFLAVSKKPAAVMDAFVAMPDVASVIAHGGTKSSVKLKSGVNIDLRVVPAESYGAALNYFTGSKDHNVALRQICIKKGLKLNEYGLSRRMANGEWRMVAGKTEKEIYAKLGMDYIEPELRENTGEIEAALRQAQGKPNGLPKLIGYGDVQGDLQVQTDWTDGKESIEAMARKAMAFGLKYIVITDHTKRLAMTHGLDEKRIIRQWVEIDKVNKKLGGRIKVLKGTECDILKDGTLDLPDKTLAKLDVVGVSVHSHFNLSRAEQTARIIRAISNPHADILFHPTGRILNRRPAYEVDMEAIIAAAKKMGTVLEIDALERLDLNDEHIRRCVDAGVKMAIDSDAHASAHYSCLEYGIAQARRGWATRGDIVNAWPLEKMLRFLK
jgi:DNA polymerase (family 10)